MLTGLTRYRLGWRKKIVLQVSEWVRNIGKFPPAPGDEWRPVWRDATFQDVVALAEGSFSKDRPVARKMPPPPRPVVPQPQPFRRKYRDLRVPADPTLYDVGVEAAYPARADDWHDWSEM